CEPFTPQELTFCDLVTVGPGTCSFENPATCPTGSVCGRLRECAALDAGGQPIPCGHPDCVSGVCGTAVPVCIDPDKEDACSDRGPNGECIGVCFGSFACGTVEAECAIHDDGEPLECSETALCPEPNSIDEDVDPLTDPGSNLGTEEFSPDETFTPPEVVQEQYPSAKPPGCGDPGEPDCAYADGKHPWCVYTITDPALPAVGVSDTSLYGDKKGSGGSTGPIRFDFDPNLELTFDAGSPLPLGDSEFFAQARASATASVSFENLLGLINGDVNILDALGEISVHRCGMAADARLKLFGYDFLPGLMGPQNHALLNSLDTPDATRAICEDGIADFVVAVSRAQKALRDAQELIRQQKQLVANGMRYSPDLCHQLLELGEGVPAGFPTRQQPFAGCGSLSPEDTINLFVRYYRQQVFDLIIAQAGLLGKDPSAGGTVPNFTTYTIPFVGTERRETQQLVSFTFPIGPVPMTVTVEAFAKYGLAGGLTFELNPDAIRQTYLDSNPASLAFADATITPYAGAGVA
ncbi:MAG TPA: hypothetical protein VGK73_26660, partial [Polyangiaceae bacterium]